MKLFMRDASHITNELCHVESMCVEKEGQINAHSKTLPDGEWNCIHHKQWLWLKKTLYNRESKVK